MGKKPESKQMMCLSILTVVHGGTGIKVSIVAIFVVKLVEKLFKRCFL